jgi:predicted nucleotidyltransferase
MRVFQTIAEATEKAHLPFLIIGGYAVMAHGFVRATEDLDLLAQRSKRQHWRELFEEMGFSVHNDAATFLQFNPPPPPQAGLPVDLMFVADNVFERMQLNAQKHSLEGTQFGVVSLLQLIALKCHAIQHSKRLRILKDTEDLIQLIAINRLDLNEPELRATILKHGNQEFYEKLKRACAPE